MEADESNDEVLKKSRKKIILPEVSFKSIECSYVTFKNNKILWIP